MKPLRISIRTKTLTLCVASFLLTSFILTAVVAVLVNHWKKRLVKNALVLAREHGQYVADELSGIMSRERLDKAEDLKENPSAHASIELLLKRNQNIVMAAFVNSRGNLVITRYREEKTSGTAVLDPGGKYNTSISGSQSFPELDVTIRNPAQGLRRLNLPVMRGENLLGQLQVNVSENAIMDRITYSSRLIGKSLRILIFVLFITLFVTYWFLWRIFSRHLALVRERDRLDKLATIGTLASGLAHEIRNPLNAMNVNLEVIQEEIEDPREDSVRKATEILGNLRREIGQLNQTLSNFMKFALPGKIEKQPVDLVNLVREILEFFSAEFSRVQVQVQMKVPEHANILADPTSIKQLLMNLVLNAVQAMNDSTKKRLEFTLNRDGSFWRLVLTDTGPGFGDTDPEKCFEAFYTTRREGSGFGLPIARQIAQLNGGRLWAENAQQEGGARFHLILSADIQE